MGEIESRASRMRVNPFVIYLRSCERISISVPSHMTGLSDVMITQGLPPEYGNSVPHLVDLLVDGTDVHLVMQLYTCMAVPTFHQVHEVQHDNECHWDVDISVLARARLRNGLVRPARAVVTNDDGGDDGHATPSNGSKATEDKDGQNQTFPVRVSAQRATERLFDGTLLQRKRHKDYNVCISCLYEIYASQWRVQ